MLTRHRLREDPAVGERWLLWLTVTLLACGCVQLLMADDAKPQHAKKVAPEKALVKEDPADTKQAAAKHKTEKKAAPPPGYEDAPQAGRVPARKINPVEAVDMAAEGFAQVLALKVDANVVNIEKQFLPQFKPVLTAELSFINRVCDLDLEQRKKIGAVSEQCLKAAVRKYAIVQNGMMRGGFRRPRTIPDPTALLHLALTKPLRETLRPAQLTTYGDEMAKRTAYRRQVAIENVVAMLDERLVLTVDQRKKLSESLEKNWQPTWVQSIEMLLNNNQYLPNIPDHHVVSALNENQVKVWRATQKQNFMVWGGFGWGQQVGAVDDFPLVEVEVETDKAAVN